MTLISLVVSGAVLIARDDDEMFLTRSFNVTPKTTAQHLIAPSDKSVAYVTNNKRLRSTFCTIEAILLIDTYRAASLRQQSYLLSRRSRQRERLHATGVHMFVCLSVAKLQKRDFLKKLSNLELWCLLTTYRKSYTVFSKNPLLDPKIQDGADPPS